MTADADTVKDWKGQLTSRPVQLRALASRFRNGETLNADELRILQDYAVDNGNALLLERVKQEIRTEKTE